ncbi:hypothetical protein [Nocardia callitridis]|uniref:Mce-associated membrane protein n=1 Tax=Nocardia callitridis TaxID=648753 RepID=A0ABP9KA59_9NOCA
MAETLTETTETATGADSDAAEPSTAESSTAESSTVDASTGEQTRPGRARRGRPRIALAAVAVLLVAATAIAVVVGVNLQGRTRIDAASRQARTAAEQYAVALTSIDAARIDEDFDTVQHGATGEFQDMYSRSAQQLKPLLLQARSVSKGRVVNSAVQSATENHAVVLLFVDAEITNLTNPDPRVDRNRIVMTMDKVDGRWLASQVELT